MSSRRSRNLTDYSHAGLRHKLLLLSPALVLAIAVGTALGSLPDLYKSTAIIALANRKSGESDLTSRLSECQRRVTSGESFETILVKYASSGESIEASTAKMRGRISIESGPQSGACDVSYRAADPETTRQVTTEIANLLVTDSLPAPAAFERELEALRERAADISSHLRDFDPKDPRLSVEAVQPVSASAQPVRIAQPSAEFARAQQMTMDGLKDQQYKSQQVLADVERRIIEQRQIVEQQRKGSALRDNPTYGALIPKRTELQGQHAALINRQQLTDKHPRVLAISDQIEAINRQIEEFRRQDSALVSQSPQARELATLTSERNRLKIELEVTGRELVGRSSDQSVSPAPEPQLVRFRAWLE